MLNIIPSCTQCGACCCNPDPKWIEVTSSDVEYLDVRLIQSGDIEPYAMLMLGNRCISLEGEIGCATRCLVYPSRPAICRKVQPGDAICLASLKLFNIGYLNAETIK